MKRAAGPNDLEKYIKQNWAILTDLNFHYIPLHYFRMFQNVDILI